MNQNSKEQNLRSRHFFRASARDFNHVPGSPIAYWLTNQVLSIFNDSPLLSDVAQTRLGMTTANNSLFTRFWFEVSRSKIGTKANSQAEFSNSGKTWVPYNKGGAYRKWYGNNDFILFWENEGEAIKTYGADTGRIRSTVPNTEFYFLETITWSKISSGKAAFRYRPPGSIFDVAGACIFPSNTNLHLLIGFLNSAVPPILLAALSPTLNFEGGQMGKLPIRFDFSGSSKVAMNSQEAIAIAKSDWDSQETSWNFEGSPLLTEVKQGEGLLNAYQAIRNHWYESTIKMKHLEESNNQLFIDAYALRDELTPTVPAEEITLINNPSYRYRRQRCRNTEDLESQFVADTMRDFISYAVGCMLGRYSIDESGLILASQGESLEDYLKRVPEPTFYPTENNVIPIVGGGWFADDITEQFRRFVKVTFGEEHYEENLEFIETALNTKNRRQYNIEDYFLKEFYTDHVTRYQKRPIYWLFSSPKGSFNALIYMHRYNTDTINILLNEYLREFQTKLLARKASLELISTSARDSSSRTQAIKELEETNKILSELNDYERDIIFPLATEKIEIDLDDGVKANYPKFGKALKKVAGL